jgi:hypothetical protein
MTRSRTSASLAFATALAASALSAMVVVPIAHATPLDDIAGTVKRDRPATCPPLVYNGGLEGIAQDYARKEDPSLVQTSGGYDGTKVGFLGSGDPQARALTSAYERGAGGFLSKCDFTDFGVGFIRYEDRPGDGYTGDVVTIVFGKPTAAPKVDTPVAVQTKPCEGSAPVPVADTCPVVKKEVPLPSPDSISMSVAKVSGSKINVIFTNSSDVAGSCDYVASPTSPDPLGLLPTINKTVQVKAKGTGALNGEKAPPIGVSYHLEATCTGTVDGASVPLGHPETDV